MCWIDLGTARIVGWHRGLERQWCTDACQRAFFASRGELNLQEQAYLILTQIIGRPAHQALEEVGAIFTDVAASSREEEDVSA